MSFTYHLEPLRQVQLAQTNHKLQRSHHWYQATSVKLESI